MMCRGAQLLLLLALTACGGGSASPSVPPVSRADAARFLRQATFGPTAADLDRVANGGYGAWFDQQLAAPPSTQLGALQALTGKPTQDDRVAAWMGNAVQAPDQLRQRVAFALSQIMVVSERSNLAAEPAALAAYYDLLARDALGNYRTLLGDVTLSPAMGVYLSMLGNRKADAAHNIRPDENYAREVLQLFTIGLVRLNPDGTVQRDAGGVPLPTYDQSVVEGFARVFTGWTFGASASFFQPSFDYLQPMQAFEDQHSSEAKALLDGTTLPAGQTARQDLDAALDLMFHHPNVGPFIGRQLIQRLVSSNPSPAYVGRVARVFGDNGRGVRGDLAAVVRAILTDAEARGVASDTAGKLVEPILGLTALWRAYQARAASGRYLVPGLDFVLGQAPLRSPSVFNFYRPDYAPPGEMRDLGLAAPEMQIINEFQTAMAANLTAAVIYGSLSPATDASQVRIDLTLDSGVANDADQLVTAIAGRLTGGVVSPGLRAAAVAMVERLPASAPTLRVAEALHTVMISPEYALLR